MKAHLALLTKAAEKGQSGLTISEPVSGGYKRTPIIVEKPTPAKWSNGGLPSWPVVGLAIMSEPAGGVVLAPLALETAFLVRKDDTLVVDNWNVEDIFELSLMAGK